MADNKLELVVEVDVGKANASIKSINSGLSSIEQAAAKTARGASSGIDGITVSMVKGATAGNLLADAIKNALSWAKEWTVGAALAAANDERLVAVTRSLAKAHGDGVAAAEKAMDAIRQVGFTSDDATASVQKLIIADIGLEKATGLAKIAKDAAAVSTDGLDAAQAFEKLMLAIETGQSRGLRTMSLFPKMAEAEEKARLQAQLHGKTLSDLEVKQVRYNAIVEASKTIQGSAAEAAGTFDGQTKKLSRDLKDLKEDVGREFQGELMVVMGIFKGMVGWLKDNTDLLAKFGKGTLALVGIIGAITAATKAWALAQGALNFAMSVNPAFLLAGGIIGAGAVIYKEYSDMQEGMKNRREEMQNTALRGDVLSGKVKIADLRKQGMSDDQIRELLSGRKLGPGETALGAGIPKVNVAGGPDLEALKLAVEIWKRQADNERFFQDRAIAATGAGKTGFAKNIAEINAAIAKQTSFVDDKGVSHQVALTKAAWNFIIDEAQKKLQAFKDHFALENRKALAEYLKDEEEASRKLIEYEAHRYQQRLQNDLEIASRNMDHVRDVYAFEEQRASFERDARLRQIEGVDAQTLEQKVAVEQQKAAIEIEYLEMVHEVKQRLYDMDTSRMLMEEELNLRRLGYQADAIKARIADLSQQREVIRQQGDDANDDAIQAARENASIRQAQMVRDHNRQMFDSLKQQAGGVFDALLSKSKSVWSAIGDSFKTAILTAIKEVVTSRLAAMLMQLFTGSKVSFAPGGMGGGGTLGRLGGILGIGAAPVFAGGGGSMSLSQIFGGPGGTSGFAGPVQMAPGLIGVGQNSAGQLVYAPLQGGMSSGGLGSRFGGALPFGAAMAGGSMFLAGIRGGTGVGGTINRIGGGAMLGAGAGAMIGSYMGAGAGFGAGVGLPIGLGAGFMADGWKRGGAVGFGESMGGGALAGATIGSMIMPGIGTAIGAAIGAGVGLVGSLIGKFRKSAEQKLRDKIRSLYHVEVRDKALLTQIVETAKQYGGNLDMTIRAPQVAELLELYALSTGQQFPMRNIARPFVMAQTGGSLYQMPSYDRGEAYGYSGLPMIGGGNYQPVQGGQAINVQLDPQATREFLEGRMVSAISDNPEVVVSATSRGASRNVARRDLAASVLAPGTVLS